MSPENKDTLVQDEKEVATVLEDLLAAVTNENLHPEVDADAPAGKEVVAL